MIGDVGVSVIVPIYNVSAYLKKCISSILTQTYPYLQIILVDDGSTDQSSEICDFYQRQDHRIQVIHRKNGGLVSARKEGLQASTGRYICYVDGDDWLEADMIEQLIKSMMQTDADLVISNHFCDLENMVWKVQGRLKAGIYDAKDLIPMMLYTGEFYEFGIHQFVWGKLYRKEILWDIQMQVDDRITCGEDVAVTYPYILKAEHICILDYAGYHYLQRAGSMTSCYYIEAWMQSKILLKYLQRIFQSSVDAGTLMTQLNQYAKNLLLARQIHYFDTFVENKRLMPYGGIPEDARVVIYGAGKLGQSIYYYLMQETSIEVIYWVDKNYELYQKMHLKVHNPEKLRDLDDSTYDFLMIGINSQKTVNIVEGYLAEMSVRKEKIRWLSEDFIKEEHFILDKL
ncbi:MAG: glycosyltransferase family 2 protein [Lachnospiraceae bacterium]|nr:glycosyltransferase family 2 protein [Lachnospiraceae bacterium]